MANFDLGGDGREALTRPGLRAFFNIAEAWDLSTLQQMRLLGLRSRSTLCAWKRGEVRAISRDALERISYVLGIYKALHILLPEQAAADAWVKRPNAAPLFSGRSALERMTAGNVGDLLVIRQFLDAQQR
jgi:hypothetical protein